MHYRGFDGDVIDYNYNYNYNYLLLTQVNMG